MHHAKVISHLHYLLENSWKRYVSHHTVQHMSGLFLKSCKEKKSSFQFINLSNNSYQ